MAVPVFKGKFTAAAAERLLWRAGFGPRPGESAALAKLGLHRAVRILTRPGPEQLLGPEPTDDRGFPTAQAATPRRTCASRRARSPAGAARGFRERASTRSRTSRTVTTPV